MEMRVKDAIVGLCVADALGVPVEFCSRESLQKNPVTGMRAYGTYNQPAGTWSDDTSMTLCLADSLQNGLDYKDIMDKFLKWLLEGCYTPHGEAFDIGRATRAALTRYANGTEPLACGGRSEHDNGNGSLMRILPLLFYLQTVYGPGFVSTEEAMGIIHNVSALTHAHKRSQIACGIYLSIAGELVQKNSPAAAVAIGTDRAFAYYKKHAEFAPELTYYNRLTSEDFARLPVKEIKSSGYVVHSLEAALWCLLNTNTYRDCVLLAVNLGDDTDTVAAIAGGLAGICYGYGSIPGEWLDVIVKLDYIENLCRQYEEALINKSMEKLCSYMPYFRKAAGVPVPRQCSVTQEDGVRQISFPVYDDTLDHFIRDFYNSFLVNYEYADIIEKYPKKADLVKAIQSADRKTLSAILTFYIRQERFCDGAWAEAMEEGIFLQILQRLQQLSSA